MSNLYEVADRPSCLFVTKFDSNISISLKKGWLKKNGRGFFHLLWHTYLVSITKFSWSAGRLKKQNKAVTKVKMKVPFWSYKSLRITPEAPIARVLVAKCRFIGLRSRMSYVPTTTYIFQYSHPTFEVTCCFTKRRPQWQQQRPPASSTLAGIGASSEDPT